MRKEKEKEYEGKKRKGKEKKKEKKKKNGRKEEKKELTILAFPFHSTSRAPKQAKEMDSALVKDDVKSYRVQS
ncbi:hypothetical protein HZH68_004081 [Vespula germanica]|uniref:Uncharacterized protein n=1 Tax=Vespula germanica TaxID=30212 RepID=A0A834NHW6_VESGE|nr:hypothetical protein HZH68_004081 [Vespula germanica]